MFPDPNTFFEFSCGSKNQYKVNYKQEKEISCPYIVGSNENITDINSDELNMLGV